MKIVIAILAVVGAFFAIGIFFPSLFQNGFRVSGHMVTFGVLALCGVGYLAIKAK